MSVGAIRLYDVLSRFFFFASDKKKQDYLFLTTDFSWASTRWRHLSLTDAHHGILVPPLLLMPKWILLQWSTTSEWTVFKMSKIIPFILLPSCYMMQQPHMYCTINTILRQTVSTCDSYKKTTFLSCFEITAEPTVEISH